MRLAFWALLVLGLTSLVSSMANASTAWIIKKETWTATDEKNYSAFVQALGESGCTRVDRCLKSPANPYRASDSTSYRFSSDCAKFPYLLRAYFAWKNGLPFSYATEVESNDRGTRDIRYSKHGNRVTRRRDVVQRSGPINGVSAVRSVADDVFTAMFRVNPSKDDPNGQWSDFYSAAIKRGVVRPGTMVYDADGHVVVVYKVESDGRVRYFDAHPDNSVSHGTYGKKFARTGLGQGGGFKNFRPLHLVGAHRGSSGELIGGRVRTVANSEISSFSLEQYKRGQFEIDGEAMGFQDFVRARLGAGGLKYHPLEELSNGMQAICGDIKDRVVAVQTSIDAHIHEKGHPDRLPENIYGTSGEWETYSSPSRDARLKTSIQELLEHIQEMVQLYKRGSSRIDYQGSNLPVDLRTTYEKTAGACQIAYRKSDGSNQQLGYDDVLNRLWKLSFDPYHCPELRWGATSTEELSTCGQTSGEKINWYRAEQNLRNQIERKYNARMNFTWRELLRGGAGTGAANPPNVDLKGYLQGL